MTIQPSIFISHGAPDLPLSPSPALNFLKTLSQQLERPDAILVISAHWLTATPTVSTSPRMEAIYDFWGFPKEIYQLGYSPPGAPKLAEQVIEKLHANGIQATCDTRRGLDHGAWEPLYLMYPDADIPVTQLSLQAHQGSQYHFKIGQILASLRQENILILASGTATHNLMAFGSFSFDAAPPGWVKAFDDWLASTIHRSNTEALINYRKEAPYATQNHPSEEHFLPLLVALGAGGKSPKCSQLHSSFTYGVLSMAAYAFH